MALTVSARARWNGPSTPALIRGAALCAAAGVGLSITDYADIAKWLAVIGVIAMIVALHRFGRLGPDEPIHFQLEAPRKKKKKKRTPDAATEPTAQPAAGDAAIPSDSASDPDDAEQ